MKNFMQLLNERALSRRRFLSTAAGAAGALGTGLLWPTPALARSGKDPKPIPGGTMVTVGGQDFFVHHITPPVSGAEPSQITDLNGHVGVFRVRGTGTGTNTRTGKDKSLLFQADCGFMTGKYIGEDGKSHHGNFGFIWLDLYDGQFDLAHQLHDYNPGIPPSGLFWVARIPEDAVKFHLGSGKASMEIEDFDISDYGNLLNALLDQNEVDAEISFRASWKNVIQELDIHDATNGFEGHFVETHCFVEWSASQDGFEFESDPMETSLSSFAVIGKERNGVFFS